MPEAEVVKGGDPVFESSGQGPCFTAVEEDTLLNCYCLSLHQHVFVVGFGPPQPSTWSYHAADCQPTAPVLSVSLVQSTGMPYKLFKVIRTLF